MRTNKPNAFLEKTHEGAPAARMTAEQALRRSVLSCLLWEKEFYEDGESIADRIWKLSGEVPTQTLAELAVEAREVFKLRHVPLLLTQRLISYGGPIVADTIERVIQRADEMPELLSIYWRNGKRPMSKQLKLGLARAFRKFDRYQLAKYNRDNAIKLRDVLFLSHAKPINAGQASMWKDLIDGKLEAPDTWEVALSAGADKRETWERLIREDRLGYLALLRNLRNMQQANVPSDIVEAAILARKGAQRVLPFRYVAAARAAPQYERALDRALCASLGDMPPLTGKTLVLVDVSGSMDCSKLSARSDLTRMDAAAALAAIIPGDVRMFSFSTVLKEVPPRQGMAGVDAIISSQQHGGTDLFAAIHGVNAHVDYDRIIVITDEQAFACRGSMPDPKNGAKGYMINVASAKNGVGYGKWTHIDGFSEAVLNFISENEKESLFS